MRKPLVVANWKMHTSLAEAIVLATSIRNAAADLSQIEIVLCSPFVWLYPIAEIFHTSPRNLKLGAQDCYFTDEGPVTGEVSAKMLKHLCRYVLVGHSERRRLFGESDAMINDKVKAVLRSGLSPILAVGEFKKMYDAKRERGRPTRIEAKSDIFHQIRAGLSGIPSSSLQEIAIAYEPVWAISTTVGSVAADGVYVSTVIAKIRQFLYKTYSRDVAASIRILYGGSVDAENISQYALQPEIDGVLVGAASLKTREFIGVCREFNK